MRLEYRWTESPDRWGRPVRASIGPVFISCLFVIRHRSYSILYKIGKLDRFDSVIGPRNSYHIKIPGDGPVDRHRVAVSPRYLTELRIQARIDGAKGRWLHGRFLGWNPPPGLRSSAKSYIFLPTFQTNRMTQQ